MSEPMLSCLEVAEKLGLERDFVRMLAGRDMLTPREADALRRAYAAPPPDPTGWQAQGNVYGTLSDGCLLYADADGDGWCWDVYWPDGSYRMGGSGSLLPPVQEPLDV